MLEQVVKSISSVVHAGKKQVGLKGYARCDNCSVRCLVIHLVAKYLGAQ